MAERRRRGSGKYFDMWALAAGWEDIHAGTGVPIAEVAAEEDSIVGAGPEEEDSSHVEAAEVSWRNTLAAVVGSSAVDSPAGAVGHSTVHTVQDILQTYSKGKVGTGKRA